MNEWAFIKKDLEKFIKYGEILLNDNLTSKQKKDITNEINELKRFIKGNYNESKEVYDCAFYQAKNLYLKEMAKIYKKLGINLINWLIRLEKEKIFANSIKSKLTTLSIYEQKEYTIKNYEKHSKIYLPIAKQILSSNPTNQIQICTNLNDSSFSRFFTIANLPLLVVNPNEGIAILNHEIEHGIEDMKEYNTHNYYKELGPIFFEILYNNILYFERNIFSTKRIEDTAIDLEIISDYFKLMLEFTKLDFKVSVKEFKEICIKTCNVIESEFDDWFIEELEYDYEDGIKYVFSHLKAIELTSLVKTYKDTIDLIEPYINTNKFNFESDTNKFKIYESYINDVKQKTLKR